MRFAFLAGVVVGAFALSSCSSSGSSNTPSTPTPTGATTVNILFSSGLGNLGAHSFSPNPAAVSQGGMLVWHNSDSTMHHLVLDDGSLDTGAIAPGASSPAKQLSVSGGRYHGAI